MKRKHHDFGIIFCMHFTLVLIFWLLPFLVNWKLVLLSAFLYYINEIVWRLTIGICPLTSIQFNTRTKDETFYYYYLTKYFKLKVDKRDTNFFASWFIPIFILMVSLVWQIILGFRPILF